MASGTSIIFTSKEALLSFLQEQMWARERESVFE